MNRIGQHIIQVFAIIASLFLVYLLYQELVLPLQSPEIYSEPMMLVMLAGYLGLLVLGGMAVRRMSDRALQAAVVIMLAVALGIQLWIAYGMQLQPEVDLVYILNQDRSMVEHGEHVFTDRSYFATHSNNIGIAIVLYWVFRIAHALGCSNYELAGGVFNVMMNMTTYICAYRIARRFYDRRVSALFLFYLVTNPALYAYASYYYTDTVSMGMTTLALALFVRAVRSKEQRGRRCACLLMSGFILLLAFRVRVTSIMALLAVVTYVILRGNYRRNLRQMLQVALPLIGGHS